jgi:uncharacterized protein YndB with AHSA1/START domain
MPNSEPKFAGVSSNAVRAKTGKGWNEWLMVLDAEDAQKMPHKEIAAMLNSKYKVPDWWCQMVTVGYEQARGLRAVHQTADGYNASASRTFNVAVGKLYDACADETARARWMGRKSYSVNKATPGKSLRIVWGKSGASRVDLYFTAKGTSKSQLAIQHSKLADSDQVQTMKTYWRGALDKLAKLLTA